MRMRSDDVDSESVLQVLQRLHQTRGRNYRHPKHSPHGIAYGPSEVRTAGPFPDDETLYAERGAVANENAKIL